jgi:hypothetical protein
MTRNRFTHPARLLVTAAALAAIVAGAVRCSGGDRVQGPDARTREGPSKALSPSAAARLSAARARTAWVAELHTAAIRDLTRDRGRFTRLRKAPIQERCAAVWQLVLKYAPLAAERAAVAIGPEIARFARERMHAHGCRGSGYDLPLLAAPAGPRAMSLFGASQAEDEATDAIFPPLQHLDEVFASLESMESPSEAERLANEIVAEEATVLRAADLNVVAGSADEATSSAWYWYNFEGNGGFEGGEDPNEMSLFRRGPLKKWGKVGYADAFGMIGTVSAAWYSGVKVWQALLVVGTIGAVVESAITAVN